MAPAAVTTGTSGPSEVGEQTRALVSAAQDGDSEAFGRLFDQFHLPLYRYIAARVWTQADAEDLAAETFAAAFLNIRHFRWRGAPFEAWLFRIARSKVADHGRRMQRRPTCPLDGPVLARLVSPGDPARRALESEERTQLLAAVRHLSPDQQEVIALRFFAELSVVEVGRVMGRSVSAVRQLQFRAVTTLRRHLDWLR
jgi:RNA polymerase sigma-70 factor (ECF subfamily)